MSARFGHGAVVAVALAAVTLAACGPGAGDGDGGAVDGSGLPTTTYPDDAHQEQLEDNAMMIERADGDLCILAEADPADGPNADTSEQVEMSVAMWSDWLVAVAEPLAATSPEGAAALRDLAERLPAEAARQDHPSDFWDLPTTRALVDDPSVEAAMDAIAAQVASCTESQPTTTIGP